MRDEWFIRGKVPMTKSEVRAAALSILELDKESVLWDIGAGTGSVSIEALHSHHIKEARAFEKNAEAVELIQRNREKAGLGSLIIVEGEAEKKLRLIKEMCSSREDGGAGEERISVATHAFIGGTSGGMEQIVELLISLNENMRIVINVIALETLASVISMLKEKEIEAEIVQIQASRSKKAGNYHLMQGQNPVYIISFGGPKEKAEKNENDNRSETAVPRIMFAAPKSGSGKTLLTCGFLTLLKKRGLHPCSFKCGPDYIDPMFHRHVLDIPGRNLDSFFLDERGTEKNYLSSLTQSGADFAVIEGVMGYYDGTGENGTRASSYDISRITKTPVVLVLDGKGASLSLAALIKGFAGFREDSRIEGVILNRVSVSVCGRLAPQIEEETGIPVLGCLPECPEYRFESRHLGLFRPGEIEALQERLDNLAAQMEQSVNIERILTIAQSAKNPEKEREAVAEPVRKTGRMPEMKKPEPVRIGVARDEAFCFYYQENLELLKLQGAELVEFSPLHDRKLPEGLAGLLLGGGYPENYAEELSENEEMLQSVRNVWEQKIPVLAECGGFLYLHETLQGIDGSDYPMAGVWKSRAYNTGKLGRFGYITLTSPDGIKIRGHEFHYWESSDPGEDWLAEKPASERKWCCIHQDGARVCGFPHLYYLSQPSFTERWLKQCREWKKGRIG